MSVLETPEVRIHYTDTGSGPGVPLVLVHGWGGDSAEWLPLIARLPERRVLAVDLRGHGRSSAPPTGYAPADFAGDLAGLLERLDLPPVVAVGHSMGAQAVVALAAGHPAAVAGLVVLDPAYGADEAELLRIPREQRQLLAEGSAWAVRFADGSHVAATPQALRRRHAEVLAAMDPQVLAAAREALYLAPDAIGSRPAAEAALKALTCPVLTVMTSRERASWARRTVKDPRSRVELFEGCGHYLHEERPEQLSRLITDWVGRAACG
ncbi:alpha/beta fold hydrolase [Streptacidiphilus carbonis]|uniref:alpha/beta fold hydrolase n=1 Tax=Streptacidiphilus carbonis TaxID=105422 RepID=UPI0005AA727B|nr:alpha/beta hydrolase [Streptacidiphilus carbonis]